MMKKTLTGLALMATLTLPAAGQEAVPVVREHFPIRELSWDSTGGLFAYLEEDTILLRDAEGHGMVGTVEFPGVLGFSLYHEDGVGAQVIAGSSDGTVAVWSSPTLNTPPPINL